MKEIMTGIGMLSLLVCFALYCCIRVGSQEERRQEKTEWEDGLSEEKTGV